LPLEPRELLAVVRVDLLHLGLDVHPEHHLEEEDAPYRLAAQREGPPQIVKRRRAAVVAAAVATIVTAGLRFGRGLLLLRPRLVLFRLAVLDARGSAAHHWCLCCRCLALALHLHLDSRNTFVVILGFGCRVSGRRRRQAVLGEGLLLLLGAPCGRHRLGRREQCRGCLRVELVIVWRLLASGTRSCFTKIVVASTFAVAVW
jgi:hypothetical protein